MILDLLTLLFSQDEKAFLTKLAKELDSHPNAAIIGIVRNAILRGGKGSLWYQHLSNIWQNLGCPDLKPNTVRKRVLVLSNYTADQYKALIPIFAAAKGVEIDIEIGPYDSVEALALDKKSIVYDSDWDFVVLLLSEQWLIKNLGNNTLVKDQNIFECVGLLSNIVESITANARSTVLVSNFPPSFISRPGSLATAKQHVGWNLAVSKINRKLIELQNSQTFIIDTAESIHASGGRQALNIDNLIRAQVPYTPTGIVSNAREVAYSIAALSGKSHRAAIIDWDNTIWGGEIGELGIEGIKCGKDDPESLGYFMIQEYLYSLKNIGVLLGAMSKNDPEIVNFLGKRADMPLQRNDYASLQIGWGAKSHSLGQIVQSFGFGPEYCLYLDDSAFELAEVFSHHPDLDVFQASQFPGTTLNELSSARLFHQVNISIEDMHRSEMAMAQQKSYESKKLFNSHEDYLKSLNIELTLTPLDKESLERVIQLLQKTNQFNLTTRRHGISEINDFLKKGAKIGLFAYQDKFGSQGLVSVVILVPQVEYWLIESWVMSCRVLNRNVEEAVMGWIARTCKRMPIKGEYIKTQKNGLVEDLLPRLGFSVNDCNSNLPGRYWHLDQTEKMCWETPVTVIENA